jgi:hypothetical protein
MNTRKEIHHDIKSLTGLSYLADAARLHEVLHALNDKLAGIEERLQGHEQHLLLIEREKTAIEERLKCIEAAAIHATES